MASTSTDLLFIGFLDFFLCKLPVDQEFLQHSARLEPTTCHLLSLFICSHSDNLNLETVLTVQVLMCGAFWVDEVCQHVC